MEQKDNQLALHEIEYMQFEYLIKKYGFKGIVKEKQFIATNLSKKYLKSENLKSQSHRLGLYFNSDLVMVSDNTDFTKQNVQSIKGQKHITMTYRTLEVLMIGLLICKHRSV